MPRIPFILLSTSDGSPITGATPSVTISKDGAAFTAATNTPAEIGNGYYYIDLTSTETTVTNNVIVRATATGAQPTAVVWEPEPTIPSASDNATAVWGAQTKEVTIATAQADTFATAAALATVGDNVAAVKAKTDNLPESPAAVGSAMTLTEATVTAIKSGLATGLNIEAALGALEMYGDTNWYTADLSGLATQTDITDAVTALETYGDGKWETADVSELATSAELETAESNIVSAMPDVSGLPTAADIWEYTDRTLTEEISVEISSENIADITESVWNADDRTLTDLTPKPNQKNIVCTPSNVINSYGIPRLENWTNETAGTQAFDDKINTYITLAKEKMATDLNDQINAAIAYIGADNITELCAWLTGYNLYQDDESTDTDSLPEARYNQYLEQIHRIMENI